MDNWQSWVTVLAGLAVSILILNYKRDKKRADDAVQEFYRHKLEVMERITRIEAEIMTEREVREILQEFLHPFLASLNKIDNKTDNIQKDLTDLKVQLAALPKRRKDNE